MIRFRGTVEYEGGEVVSFQAGSKALVAWEAYCRRQGIAPYDGAHPQTLEAYVAFTALGIREGFDVWLASTIDVDTNPTEEALEAGRRNAELAALAGGATVGGAAAVDPFPAGASRE